MKHAYELFYYQIIQVVVTVLVHYMGDKREAVKYSHGNVKYESPRPYVRTCPSVLQGLKDECKASTVDRSPSAYRNQITSPTQLYVCQITL